MPDGGGAIPMVDTTASTTWSAASAAVRSTHHTPSGNSATAARATSTASRVLPHPAAPASVTQPVLAQQNLQGVEQPGAADQPTPPVRQAMKPAPGRAATSIWLTVNCVAAVPSRRC